MRVVPRSLVPAQGGAFFVGNFRKEDQLMSEIHAQREQLQELTQAALPEIEAATNLKDLDAVRVKYMGRSGLVTEVSKVMKDLSNEARPQLGQLMNDFRNSFTQVFDAKKEELEEAALQEQLASEAIDMTLPGRKPTIGARHIITQTMEEIEDLFIGMGYQIIEGPEVELDLYNFEMMNLPQNHPARDMQDSFYIDSEVLLRTHTSPVQARTMLAHNFEEGPLKMISPGKVFRRDNDDATHSHQFHQIEGLVVDKKITLADLKGTLLVFAQQLFGEDQEIRLRPSYFPFTEPSVEVDVSCFNCGGDGCSVCSRTGWIEILGAGIVHPKVLEMANIDATKYSGMAFGLGPDRVAMLKYAVEDIRHFYQNDLRFTRQFQGGQN